MSAGLTQLDLQGRAGLPGGYVSRYEAGRKKPDKKACAGLAKALNEGWREAGRAERVSAEDVWGAVAPEVNPDVTEHFMGRLAALEDRLREDLGISDAEHELLGWLRRSVEWLDGDGPWVTVLGTHIRNAVATVTLAANQRGVDPSEYFARLLALPGVHGVDVAAASLRMFATLWDELADMQTDDAVSEIDRRLAELIGLRLWREANHQKLLKEIRVEWPGIGLDAVDLRVDPQLRRELRDELLSWAAPTDGGEE